MQLGRVIGTVWATRKDERLEGLRLLIVQDVDLQLKPKSSFTIAVDSVQAGIGELVLVCKGSSARQTRVTKDRPVDAVIMASVDNFELADAKELESAYRERASRIEACLDGYPEP